MNPRFALSLVLCLSLTLVWSACSENDDPPVSTGGNGGSDGTSGKGGDAGEGGAGGSGGRGGEGGDAGEGGAGGSDGTGGEGGDAGSDGTGGEGGNAGEGGSAGSGGFGGEPAACSEEAMDFSACGGDLTGSWEVVSVCPEAAFADAIGSQLEKCPDGQLSFATAYPDGFTITFADSTAFFSAASLRSELEVLLPLDCVPDVFDVEVDSCEELSDPELGVYTDKDLCTCSDSGDDPSQSFDGPYSTTDGTFSIQTPEEWQGRNWEDIPYCVDGDKLAFVHGNTIGDVGLLHVFQRKKPD